MAGRDEGGLNVYDTIALLLLANEGKMQGRTVLQKLVYLSSIIVPKISNPSYKAHYYGPFSPKLSLALEKMVSYSFLEEVRMPGFMYEGYSYRLTKDGENLAIRAKTNHPVEFKKIEEIIKTCDKFCKLKSAPLSFASKVFFLLQRLPTDKRKMTYKDAISDAENLGWDISNDDVEQGVELLKQLNLVEYSS